MEKEFYEDIMATFRNPNHIPRTIGGIWARQQVKPPPQPPVPRPVRQPKASSPVWTVVPDTPTPAAKRRPGLRSGERQPRQQRHRRRRLHMPAWLVRVLGLVGIGVLCAIAAFVSFLLAFGAVEAIGGEESALPLFIWVETHGGGWLWLALWAASSALHYYAAIGLAVLAERCAAGLKRAMKKAAHKLGMALISAARD